MPLPVAKPRTRAPVVTREKLLAAAFEEMYHHGFQAASLDTILAAAGMTKGALYHHFPNKTALGLAVVDEVIKPFVLRDWLSYFTRSPDDPLTAINRAIRNKIAVFVREGHVSYGCPLQNLTQEMAPVDEAFRQRLNAVFDGWRAGFADALRRGQTVGTVRDDVDATKVAAFIIASAEGSFGLAKSANSMQVLRSSLEILQSYVESLRVPGQSSTSRPRRGDAPRRRVA
jgi:TetR/AcrR family transcriptional regulator, transcriptional repressor for nem operon